MRIYGNTVAITVDRIRWSFLAGTYVMPVAEKSLTSCDVSHFQMCPDAFRCQKHVIGLRERCQVKAGESGTWALPMTWFMADLPESNAEVWLVCAIAHTFGKVLI